MARLKNILLIGRIFLGMAFGIYGYLHFTYTARGPGYLRLLFSGLSAERFSCRPRGKG